MLVINLSFRIKIEIGWSLYETVEPDEYNQVLSTLVEGSRNPHWNQELLLSNPPELLDLSGFFWLIVKDKNQP
jgi:hypothetical protein